MPSDDERVWAIERDLAQVKAWQEDLRASSRSWILALTIAAVGIFGSILAAAVAYGELRQQAQTSAVLLGELRTEIAQLRAEVRRAAAD